MEELGIVGAHSNVINKLKTLDFEHQEIVYFIKKIMRCCIRGMYRHRVSLLFYPGDVLPVTLCLLDTMPYSSVWCS